MVGWYMAAGNLRGDDNVSPQSGNEVLNYYHRHLGDYAKDTTHLNVVEHGVYNLLIDWYYGTERGLPAELVYRIAKAFTAEQRAAVDFVLAEFFQLQGGIWTSKRCDKEIKKAQHRMGLARQNGKKGGRPANLTKTPGDTALKPMGFHSPVNRAESSPISNLKNKNSEGLKSLPEKELRTGAAAQK